MLLHDRIVSYTDDKCGNRKKHNNLLLLLEKFDAHCKQYRLPYSLAYGSALGCVRNQGFIPWDDDVDIMMKRADYDRFFKTLQEGKSYLSKDCYIQVPLFLPKIYDSASEDNSIHIDVYAIDNAPDGYIKRNLKLLAVQTVKNVILGRCGIDNTVFRKVRKACAIIISFPFGVVRIKESFTAICTKDNSSRTSKVSSYFAGHRSIGKYFPYSMMEKIKYMKFEDIELPVMEDYDMYLTMEYGNDYMTPKTKTGRTIKC